jgi:hypothetical protein
MLLFAAVAMRTLVMAAPSAGPVHLESGVAQLFVDDEMLDSGAGFERTLHSPVKEGGGNVPLIAAKPGSTLLAYGTIVWDARMRRYVMFTQGFPERHMYRFTSKDGLDWDVGSGKAEFEEVSFGPPPERETGSRGKAGIDLFSCFYDSADSIHPYKGWLYYANYGPSREGIYFVRSVDGRRWERLNLVVNAWAGPGDGSARRIEQDGKTVYGPGDVTLFYHDPLSKRFLGLFKFFTSEKVGEAGNNLRSRVYLFLDRLDAAVDTERITRVALLPPARQADGNDPADEFYASTAWRYESLWLGGLKIWHGQGEYPWSAAGCAFLKLVVSRDGLNWKKVPFRNECGVPEVFIANGAEGGNGGQNDGGYISEFSQGPLRIGNELVYYYSASSWGKNADPERRLLGGGIFRGRLRVDGFVSISAGTIVTKLILAKGKELCVNAVGPVRARMLDRKMQILGEAFIVGDSVQHRVNFNDLNFAAVAGGSPVHLQFQIEPPGRLYSFTIK